MPIYRFKSRETADLVMLEPDGRRILEVLGKDSATGIIRAQDMSGAAMSLSEAAQAEELSQKQLKEAATAKGEPEPAFDPISLRQRSVPLLEMMRRCESANVDIVWGV